jgi:agmatine deiminase
VIEAARIRIPADYETHGRTVMAWAVHREWGADRERVEQELDRVIRTIAEYEAVMLLTPPGLVQAVITRKFGAGVQIVPAPVDDIWMRDIAPVFAKHGNETVAIDMNFNGWDNSPKRASRPGDRLARTHNFGVPVIGATFVGEGGAFVTNGNGVAVATRSCLCSRNPNLDEKAIAAGFAKIGIRDLIWIDGDRDEPITTGHPDGYLAFQPDGGLIVELPDRGPTTRSRHRDVQTLKKAVADGRLTELTYFAETPRKSCLEFAEPEFAATYMNLYPVNGAVLTARFGDPLSDRMAEAALQVLYPGREIRMLDINAILRGGGGIRCLTQPMPVSTTEKLDGVSHLVQKPA